MKNGNFDSVLSVVPFKRFIWNIENEPVNYNYKNRPRRQDSKKQFLENGAIYSTYRKSLMKSKNRLSGNIGRIEMDELSSYEIDSYQDWTIIENLLINRLKAKKSLSPIKCLRYISRSKITTGCPRKNLVVTKTLISQLFLHQFSISRWEIITTGYQLSVEPIKHII